MVAELELAEAARRASDFARGMVPNGHASRLEPGSLVYDALQLIDHAREVLAAATRHERARGADYAGLVGPDSTGLAAELMSAAGPVSETRSENIAERLFELDTWVCRHSEPDDPIESRHPVTDSATRHLTRPL